MEKKGRKQLEGGYHTSFSLFIIIPTIIWIVALLFV